MVALYWGVDDRLRLSHGEEEIIKEKERESVVL